MTPWDDENDFLDTQYGDNQNDITDDESAVSCGNVFDDIIQDILQEVNVNVTEHDTGSFCIDNPNDEISLDEEGDMDYVDGDKESTISGLDNDAEFTGNYTNDKTKEKGNGLLKRVKLEELIFEIFLCKHCCEESVHQKKGFGKILVEDAKLKAVTHNHAFTCTLVVTCPSGKHTYKIEPDKGVTKTSVCAVQQPRQRGQPKSTMKIQHYCINFYAHIMLQMLGLWMHCFGLDTWDARNCFSCWVDSMLGKNMGLYWQI